MLTLKLDLLQTLSLAAVLYFVGLQLRQRIALLDRLNIPAAVVGGLLFALLVLVGRDRFLTVHLDTSAQTVLSVAFFSSIGMGASFALLRAGGLQVVIFLLIAIAFCFVQNFTRHGDRARVRRAPAARRPGRLGDPGGRAGHGDGLRADAGAGGAGGRRHAGAHLGHVRHRVRRADRHTGGDLADPPLPPRSRPRSPAPGRPGRSRTGPRPWWYRPTGKIRR